LLPGLKPFIHFNPAFADCHDGRRGNVYGTMGWPKGQPTNRKRQLFSRYMYATKTTGQANKERLDWLLGRTWGDT